MVKKWFLEFDCGSTRTSAVVFSGSPIEVATAQTIETDPQYGVSRSGIQIVLDPGTNGHITWISVYGKSISKKSMLLVPNDHDTIV